MHFCRFSLFSLVKEHEINSGPRHCSEDQKNDKYLSNHLHAVSSDLLVLLFLNNSTKSLSACTGSSPQNSRRPPPETRLCNLLLHKSAKALLHSLTWYHYAPSAAPALNPEIHTDSHDLPGIPSAGMRLLKPHDLSYFKYGPFHFIPPNNPVSALHQRSLKYSDSFHHDPAMGIR